MNIKDVVKERRLGVIEIADVFYEHDPAALMEVYAKILPVDISHDYALRIFRVKAYSTLFEPVELGNQLNYYTVKISKDDEGNFTNVEFNRS